MTVSMGNLLGSWRFKEPSTIEECDSTWGSDSESEEPAAAAAAAEDDSGISDCVSPADSERAAGDASPQVPVEVVAVVGASARKHGRDRGRPSPLQPAPEAHVEAGFTHW